MLIIIYFILNSIILSLLLLYTAGLSTILVRENWIGILSVEEIILFAITLELLIMGLGASNLGAYLLKLFNHSRKPTNAESSRINSLIQMVVAKHNQKLNTNYTNNQFIVNISDSLSPNIYVYGRQYIVFTTGLVTLVNDEELKAIIASELGHIWYHDATADTIKVFASCPIILSNWLFKFVRSITNSASGLNKLALIAGIVMSIIFLPIVLFGELIRRVLLAIDTLLNKNRVYRADNFASKLGYKDGLISILNKLALLNIKSDNIFHYLFTSRPSSKQRITKLESKTHL